MGAQDEYLRNFCILLTDKGVVPLTDPLQIAVYNSLLQGMKRPSDLTSELNLSSSSLHFIIDKMAENGIIDRTKPESDKKTVYYSTNAKVLASSTETNDRLRNVSQKTFVDPLKNYKGLSTLSNMLDCYMSEIGVDIDPLKMKYADALADSIEMEKAGMEDAVMNVRDIFSRITGHSFSVFSFSPLTLVVTGDENIMDKSKILMEFVIRLIENSTGRTYKIVSTEPFNGADNMIKVTMDRTEKVEEPYMNTSLHHKDADRFLMVDVDGSAGLMTSDVQIDIINAIYERPLCITDIVTKVDSPRSTITSNLLRMVEEGVISVFYSESGSAYYGLACSILLKKSRPISYDRSEMDEVLDKIKDKEGGFMEGQLLYTLALLKMYGFDSEYTMVVLGAKYMRASGSMDVQGSFDTYFGKMSDIAQAIGLSLNIVSVYPLTIGISSRDPDSEMSQAMTFIKGMAHQGLEMASSGIFVRSSEESATNENISFKEIYPSLSMKPVKGVMIENLSPAPSAKKRTSSVKTALLNRSKKDSTQSTRSVRYITAAVFMVMLSAILVFGATGTGSDLSAETFELTVDSSLEYTVYDEDGNELTYPYSAQAGDTLSLVLDDPTDIGYVRNGMAFLMSPADNGVYSIKMNSDLNLVPLFDVSDLTEMDCTFSLYCSEKAIVLDTSSALKENEKYRSSESYMELTGGLYVSANNAIKVTAKDGYYIASNDESEKDKILPSRFCNSTNFRDMSINEIPVETRTIYLDNGPLLYGDQLIEDELVVPGDAKKIGPMKIVGDKNVMVKVNGKAVELDNDNSFIIILEPGVETHITVEEKNFY
ncbi:MAG: winged helix-turn-helix transcriptional regulator [Thermoplasmata archaeon]|nr:winged helix-turn-helix transcriptional regulator [Thermoplasmata archaeon]